MSNDTGLGQEPMAMPSFDGSPDSAALCPPLPLGEGLGVRDLESNEVAPSFIDRWQELDWDDVGMQIRTKTALDVERALSAPRRTLQDFMALISPAAEPFLPRMAELAERLTRQRFGNTVGFYVPLYLSNLCANDCSYCGFSMSNRLKRKTLNSE